MPEDEIFEIKHRIGEIAVELNDKISEFEKKQISFNNALHIDIDKNIKAIEKLEKEFNLWKTEDYEEKENAKKISELKALIKAHDINLDSLGGSMQNRKDEIAELKINIDTIKNKVNDNEEFIANDKIELSELKEDIHKLYGFNELKGSRIEELEKKLDHKDARVIITDADKQVIWVEGFMERLEKREKWKEEFRNVEDISQQYKEKFDVLQEELSELKERVEGIFKSIHGMNGGDSPRIKTFKKAGLNVVSSEDELKEFFKNGGEKTVISKKEVTHIPFSPKAITDSKPPKVFPKRNICPDCKGFMEYRRKWKDQDENLIYEFYCSKCNQERLTEYPLSYLQKEKPPEPKGKILICPNCMRQYEFKHREYKIVEKADLEKLFKYLDLGNLYDPTIRKLEEKYLTEEAEKKE